jgi:hypothetical protein
MCVEIDVNRGTRGFRQVWFFLEANYVFCVLEYYNLLGLILLFVYMLIK